MKRDKTIDITHARTLTDMSAFLQYLVSIYGAELYKDKQRLYNLIADLYTGEERQKKLFRRAILEDNMAQRVYELQKKKLGERKALADAIAYRFAENNYFPSEIGQKVTLAFVKGLNLLLEFVWKQRDDGKWEDNQGCIYSEDREVLEQGNFLLTDVIIPEGVISIGESAFSGCVHLSSVIFSNSITEIGSYAFSGCSSLSALVIPDRVTNIGCSVFRACTSLESITIPKTMNKIDDFTFFGCISLKSISISAKIIEIGCGAFYNCINLQNIKIPASVKRIKPWAFNGCTSLETVKLPEEVPEIGSWAFQNCVSLKTCLMTIPRYIGDFAFDNCPSLLAYNEIESNSHLKSCVITK